jgi:hypothetical protein
MYKSALGGYTNATDAADWLVKKALPSGKRMKFQAGLSFTPLTKK